MRSLLIKKWPRNTFLDKVLPEQSEEIIKVNLFDVIISKGIESFDLGNVLQIDSYK